LSVEPQFRRWPRRLRDAALPGVLGLFIMLFGLRQTVAALILVPENRTIVALQGLESPDPAALDRLVAAEQTSLHLHETAEGWSNLGLALAVSAGPGDTARLAEAKRAVIQSLIDAPANPYVWTRLAVLDQMTGADRTEIRDSWRMSYLTGPNEERLHIPRITIAIGIWPELTGADRANVFTELHATWVIDKSAVVDLARDSFTTNLIRASLVNDLPSMFAFDKMMKQKN